MLHVPYASEKSNACDRRNNILSEHSYMESIKMHLHDTIKIYVGS